MPSEKAKKRSSSNGTGYVEPIPYENKFLTDFN